MSNYRDWVIQGIAATQLFLSDTGIRTLREDRARDCSHLQKAAAGMAQLSDQEERPRQPAWCPLAEAKMLLPVQVAPPVHGKLQR